MQKAHKHKIASLDKTKEKINSYNKKIYLQLNFYKLSVLPDKKPSGESSYHLLPNRKSKKTSQALPHIDKVVSLFHLLTLRVENS